MIQELRSPLCSYDRHTRSASFSASCLRCSSHSFSSYWLYSFLVISLITSALASWEDSTCRGTLFRAMAFAAARASPLSLCMCHHVGTQRSGPIDRGPAADKRQQELMAKHRRQEEKRQTDAQKGKSGTLR